MGLKVLALSPSGDGNPAPSVAIARDEGGSMISSSKNGLQASSLCAIVRLPVHILTMAWSAAGLRRRA